MATVEVGSLATLLRTLFEPDDMIEFRCLPSRRRKWVRARDLDAHLPELLNMTTENVYFGCNPRKGSGGKAEDVALARCLCCDWDNGTTAEQAEAKWKDAGLPEPTALIFTGGGHHAYWKLAEPLTNLVVWTGYQKALIDAVGSDKAIHDPPRIMRLPGSFNAKRNIEGAIVFSDPSRLYAIDDFGLVPVVTASASPERGPVVEPGRRGKLRNITLQFLIDGCDEGERDNRLFAAAVEMLGAGWSIEEATPDLERGAARCRPPIAPADVRRVLASAASKPRTAFVEEQDEDWNHWQQPGDPPKNPNRSPSGAPRSDIPPPQPRHPAGAGPTITNIVQAKGREDENINYAKPIEEIARNVHEATDDWPRRVSSALFVLGPYDKTSVPGASAIRFLTDHTQLFAWLHEDGRNVFWPTRITKGARNHTTGNAVTPVSRPEFYEWLAANGMPNYLAVEVLPHVPAVDNVFYVPFELPTSSGEALAEFSAHLNPDTELDRLLMLAALITPGWGGPCGAKPAFIFASKYGRGVGKTQTAELICRVWGGRVSISADKEDWREARSRLLSDDSLAGRCVIIDNVKQKLGGADIEAMISAPVIDGHKMYFGQFRRPNRLTYFLTANTPRLSTDIAVRSIPIQIGQAKHGAANWQAWAERFIDDNRLALLADIYALLAQEPACAIETENRDRWATWQDAVLARFAAANQAMSLVKERRGDVDADREDAADVRDVIETALMARGHDLATETVRIPRSDMYEILTGAKMLDRSMSVRGATTWLSNLNGGGGPLDRLISNPSKREIGRSWLYVAGVGRPGETIVDLKTSDLGAQGAQWGRKDHE